MRSFCHEGTIFNAMLYFAGANGEMHRLFKVWLKSTGHFKTGNKSLQFRLWIVIAIKKIVILFLGQIAHTKNRTNLTCSLTTTICILMKSTFFLPCQVPQSCVSFSALSFLSRYCSPVLHGWLIAAVFNQLIGACSLKTGRKVQTGHLSRANARVCRGSANLVPLGQRVLVV